MTVKLRPIKTDNYLIIGGIHRGASEDVLKIYQHIAEKTNAKVFHLGAILSDEEIKTFKKVTQQLASAEREFEVREDTMKDATKEAMEEKISGLNEELERLANVERGRIGLLTGRFSDVTFVVPAGGSLSRRVKGATILEQEAVISKYLLVSGIQPVTDRSTLRPTNRNSIMHLRQYGNQYSWIAPHPVPATIPFARPGLNNVHNYMTTGCLRHAEKPTSRNDAYKASFAPCAISVQVNPKDGTFHHQHLHIDYAEVRGYSKSQAMVLHDGECYTAEGVKEVSSIDRAVFVTDDHEPNYHPGTLGALRGLNELFHPGTLINGGDASDGGPVNRHELNLPGKMEGRRVIDMINGLRKLLTAQCNVDSIKSRVLLDSNHADWLTDFVAANPNLNGLIDWDTIQKTRFPDWRFLLRREGQQEIYMFGDYTIRHGDRESLERAELMFRKGKYMCGHWHRFTGFRRTVSIGCGGQLAPDYTENQVNAWQNQIVSITRLLGITAIAPKIVLHDKKKATSQFSYRFQIYETNHHVIK
jgi:hypothetical protein